MIILTNETRAALSDPAEIRVTRDDDRDFAFLGWLIGEGEDGTGGTSGYDCDWNRGRKFRIFLTDRGRIITRVKRWSCWQGENDQFEAAVHKDAASALAWLRRLQGGSLCAGAKAAWENACDAVPSLAGLDVERVA